MIAVDHRIGRASLPLPHPVCAIIEGVEVNHLPSIASHRRGYDPECFARAGADGSQDLATSKMFDQRSGIEDSHERPDRIARTTQALSNMWRQSAPAELDRSEASLQVLGSDCLPKFLAAMIGMDHKTAATFTGAFDTAHPHAEPKSRREPDYSATDSNEGYVQLISDCGRTRFISPSPLPYEAGTVISRINVADE